MENDTTGVGKDGKEYTSIITGNYGSCSPPKSSGEVDMLYVGRHFTAPGCRPRQHGLINRRDDAKEARDPMTIICYLGEGELERIVDRNATIEYIAFRKKCLAIVNGCRQEDIKMRFKVQG